MGRPLITRRDVLQGAAMMAGTVVSARARALGRTPVIGKLTLALPWFVGSIDPHDLFDPAAALFGHAIFDQLYALDPTGEPYPTLAAELPLVSGQKTVVRLREGLLTAKGRKLDAEDAVFSLRRARRGAALAWWGDLPMPTVAPGDPLALLFGTPDGARVARTLCSPILALLPRAFDPLSPDGTGAMSAQVGGSRLVLRRNPNAARGGSFLETISVDQAPDLSASLRSFEGNLADIGWLGSGLHAPRPAAEPFDFGSVAWIALHTGNEAGVWAAPGTAQRLLDGIPPERLQRFALGQAPGATSGTEWGGKPCELLISEGSAYLEELGRTVGSLLSRPGHEIEVKVLPGPELARRRSAGAFSLLLGVIRPFAASGLATLAALAAAVDPASAADLMRRPPRLTSFAPRLLTRTLKLGVLGDLKVLGAHAPEIRLAKNPVGEGWDLPSTYRVAGT